MRLRVCRPCMPRPSALRVWCRSAVVVGSCRETSPPRRLGAAAKQRYLRRMEESPSAPAAPEQDAVEEEKPPRERRRLRLPTPFLLTLVGIALTAWLLPAFTQQWDDRQKAQELKAAVTADMAAATARALVGGEAIWDRELNPRSVDRAAIADDWSRAAVKIEARLSAYFPRTTVVSWQIYTWFVDRYVDGYRAQAYASLLAGTEALPTDFPSDPVEPPVELDPGVASAAARVLVFADAGSTDPRPNFAALGETTYESGALKVLKSYLAQQIKDVGLYEGARSYIFAFFSGSSSGWSTKLRAKFLRRTPAGSAPRAATYSMTCSRERSIGARPDRCLIGPGILTVGHGASSGVSDTVESMGDDETTGEIPEGAPSDCAQR